MPEKTEAVAPITAMGLIKKEISGAEQTLAESVPSFRMGDRAWPDYFKTTAINYIRTHEKIQACHPASVCAALVEAASIGLPIDGKHSALIPYRDECQWQPMWQGLRYLICLSPEIGRIETAVHRSGDPHWHVQRGTDPRIDHIINDTGEHAADDSDVLHAYSVAFYADGATSFEVMARTELDKVEKAARSQGKKPAYDAWLSELHRKAVAKRHAKSMSILPVAQRAIDIDNERNFPGIKDIPAQIKPRKAIDTVDDMAARCGVEDTPASVDGGARAGDPAWNEEMDKEGSDA